MTRINTCGHEDRKHRAKGLCNSCYKKTREDKERVASNRYQKAKRQKVYDFKNVPCRDCGIAYPSYVMDFDHRPEEIKLFTVGDSARKYGWATVLAEIAKCDVVCSNCHRERTHQRRRMNDTSI
jgi:hypothetical protein